MRVFSAVVFHYYEDATAERLAKTVYIAHADTMDGLEADMQKELQAYANWQLRQAAAWAAPGVIENFCVSFNIHRFKHGNYHDTNTWDCYPNRQMQEKLVLPIT